MERYSIHLGTVYIVLRFGKLKLNCCYKEAPATCETFSLICFRFYLHDSVAFYQNALRLEIN